MIRKVFHDIGPRRESGVEAVHEFLVEEPDVEAAASRVERFLESYQLVRYGRLEILRERSVTGEHPSFRARVEEGVEENRRRVGSFIEELRGEGFERLGELAQMDQGHCSKTFHTIAHLLDGFFGIDSFFFSLPDGSHWISAGMARRLDETPERFVILAVRAFV